MSDQGTWEKLPIDAGKPYFAYDPWVPFREQVTGLLKSIDESLKALLETKGETL